MGEVTALRGIGLTYNGRGQVQSLTRPSGSVVETELYGYDTAGRRIARTRSVPNGSATTYEAHELYVYEGANLAALYSGATNAPPLADTWLYDGVDHPLRVNVRSAPQSLVYYYELDLAGNVRRLMRAGGSDAGGYRYSAFGTLMPADAKTPAAQLDQPLRWKGRLFSDFVPGAGIYDVRARAWSPEMGSFTSIDEYAFHDRRSTLWGWPGQNPVVWRDPSGHCPWCIAIGLGVGVVGMGAAAPSDTAQAPANVAGMMAVVPGVGTVGTGTARGLLEASLPILERVAPEVAQVVSRTFGIGTKAVEGLEEGGSCSIGGDAEAARRAGAGIGQALRGQATGKMESIVDQVSSLGLSQEEATLATNSAVEELGLRTAVVPVGDNQIVSSVMLGADKPVLVIAPNGSVSQAVADLSVENGVFVVKNVRGL